VERGMGWAWRIGVGGLCIGEGVGGKGKVVQ